MSEAAPSLTVEYCGEMVRIDSGEPFVIGREGDLVIDDNDYLHRRFLTLHHDRFWWLTNVGTHLSATLSDADGAMQSWMAPGATLPLLFAATDVRFTAGPTNYHLTLLLDEPSMSPSGVIVSARGTTTVQPMRLTDRQRAVVLALAEPALLDAATGIGSLPSSHEASARLGWKLTTFNRQLDAVCQKLSKAGVRGLHGDQGALASNRRARLVEYALAVRLVSSDDLPLLDDPVLRHGDAE